MKYAILTLSLENRFTMLVISDGDLFSLLFVPTRRHVGFRKLSMCRKVISHMVGSDYNKNTHEGQGQ
jgi:hypothetical protein